MNQAVPSASRTTTAAAAQRRRWPWYLLTIAVLLIGFPTVLYWYVKWSAANDTASVQAELDRLDPGWRLDDIEAKRAVLTPEENSALQVSKVVGLAGRGGLSYRKDYLDVYEKLEAPYELNAQQMELLRESFAQMPEAVQEARKLKDMPKGRFAITFTPDFFSTLIPQQQDARRVFELLQHDAWLRAQAGDLDGAVESCRAGLNAARSLGDEPIMISLLIRIAGNHVALVALERTLAQGQPTEQALGPMQELIEQEIADAQAHWVMTLRGERAGQQRIVRAINDGKIRVSAFLAMGSRSGPDLGLRLADYFPVAITRDYPLIVRHMNEAVAISQAPLEQQQERMRALDKKTPKNSILFRFMPSVETVARAHLRNQAMLRSAQVAVAAERFRLKHMRWPTTLAELEKAKLLAQAPADPYNGAPLRWRAWEEGRVAYAVGFDRTDDGGKIDRQRQHEPGVDIGFKLWDVARRRQPPRR